MTDIEQKEVERKQVVFQESQQAQLILENPLVVRFLEETRLEYFTAFENLPIDASLEEYRVVHYGLRAMNTFEAKFREYILRQTNEILNQSKEEISDWTNI